MVIFHGCIWHIYSINLKQKEKQENGPRLLSILVWSEEWHPFIWISANNSFDPALIWGHYKQIMCKGKTKYSHYCLYISQTEAIFSATSINCKMKIIYNPQMIKAKKKKKKFNCLQQFSSTWSCMYSQLRHVCVRVYACVCVCVCQTSPDLPSLPSLCFNRSPSPSPPAPCQDG